MTKSLNVTRAHKSKSEAFEVVVHKKAAVCRIIIICEFSFACDQIFSEADYLSGVIHKLFLGQRFSSSKSPKPVKNKSISRFKVSYRRR